MAEYKEARLDKYRYQDCLTGVVHRIAAEQALLSPTLFPFPNDRGWEGQPSGVQPVTVLRNQESATASRGHWLMGKR